MICRVCGYEDKYVKSNFCKVCGKAFSDEDRREAYGRTVYGKIDALSEAKSWLTLSKITDNIFFRIAVLLVLAALVLFNIAANGSKLAIRNGEDYSLAYCEQTDEYYVFTEKESVRLSVYLPKKTESCVLESYVNGALAETRKLPQDGAVLPCIGNGYFLLRASYENGRSEELLFFVCPEAAS